MNGMVGDVPEDAEAGTRPCACPGGPDPMGFVHGGVECCLTCGGRLRPASRKAVEASPAGLADDAGRR